MAEIGTEKSIVAAFNILIAARQEDTDYLLTEDKIIGALLEMCRKPTERIASHAGAMPLPLAEPICLI